MSHPSYIQQKLFFDEFDRDLRVEEAKQYGVIIHSTKQPSRKDFEEAYYKNYKLSAPIIPGVKCVWFSLKTYNIRMYTTLYDLGEGVSSGNLYRWFGQPESNALQFLGGAGGKDFAGMSGQFVTYETPHAPGLRSYSIPLSNPLNSGRLVNLYIKTSVLYTGNFDISNTVNLGINTKTVSPFDTTSSNVDLPQIGDVVNRSRGNSLSARILIDPTPTLTYSSSYTVDQFKGVSGGLLFGGSASIWTKHTSRSVSAFMTVYNYAGMFPSIPVISWTLITNLSTTSSGDNRRVSRVTGASAPNGSIYGIPSSLEYSEVFLSTTSVYSSNLAGTMLYGLFANNDSWDYIGD